MQLKNITSNLPFMRFMADPELIKEVQAILKVDPTGVVGPTTNHALFRFCFDHQLNNYDTQLFGPTLAQKLLERSGAQVKQSAFELGLKFVLQWEGKYANNSADKGGETNYGVTWKTYDAYRDRKGQHHQSVKYITDAEVKEIYQAQYWDMAGCNQLPLKLGVAVFNWQVNSGRGVKYLQTCVGSKSDGKFGSKTLNDVNAYIKKHGEDMLVGTYLQSCEMAYKRWGVGTQSIFLKGWLRRLEALRQFLGSLDV